jgi:hypothetical protein
LDRRDESLTVARAADQQDLWKAPKAGGDYVQLLRFNGEMDALAPSSITVDGEYVYWTEPKLRRIRKLSK